jgi:hypothetical protein
MWIMLINPCNSFGTTNCFIKHSKCSFEALEVECLGHYCHSTWGESWSQENLGDAILAKLKTINILRSFLGLIDYYKNFVKNYGWIDSSLTTLPKKNAFIWINDAKCTF